MYLVIIGWIYVVLMMALAEATSPAGTVLGAVFTFVLYGALPVSLVVYLLGRRGKRRSSDQPDRGGEAPADPVAPVRKEP
jgi:membrane protein implicated in regulation of membrane protease activity